MADIKIAGRIKAGAADGISGYASEILFDDAASNKTVKEKIEEVASSPQTMIVTITPDGNDGYEADKTFAEIKAFIDNGGTVIAKDEEDGDSYYYLDNYIASEVVFTRNKWGSGGFATRYYTIDSTNTVSFIDSVHHISSAVDSSSTANLANSAAVKALRDSMSEIKSISVNNTEQQVDQEGNVDIAIPTSLADLAGDSTHRTVTDAEKSTWNGKQNALTFDNVPTANSNNPVKSGGVYQAIQDIDVSSQISGKEDKSNKVTSFSSPTDTQYPSAKLVNDQLATKQGTISDLSTIRSGASAGATAYQKPGTGIPSTDLASAVQTSLGKADTAIQSVTVGTTTTGAAGTNASVTNTGTATALVLSFTIPQGAQGIQGIQGPQGERGPQGNTGVQVDSVASIIHSIDPTATYAAADVAGADAVQDVLSEVTELEGKLSKLIVFSGGSYFNNGSYYDSNMQLVSSNSHTYTQNPIDVSEYVGLTATFNFTSGKTNAYSGFLNANDEIFGTFQNVTEIVIPEGAVKMWISVTGGTAATNTITIKAPLSDEEINHVFNMDIMEDIHHVQSETANLSGYYLPAGDELGNGGYHLRLDVTQYRGMMVTFKPCYGSNTFTGFKLSDDTYLRIPVSTSKDFTYIVPSNAVELRASFTSSQTDRFVVFSVPTTLDDVYGDLLSKEEAAAEYINKDVLTVEYNIDTTQCEQGKYYDNRGSIKSSATFYAFKIEDFTNFQGVNWIGGTYNIGGHLYTGGVARCGFYNTDNTVTLITSQEQYSGEILPTMKGIFLSFRSDISDAQCDLVKFDTQIVNGSQLEQAVQEAKDYTDEKMVEIGVYKLPNVKWYVLGDSISAYELYVAAGKHYYELIAARNNMTFDPEGQVRAADGRTVSATTGNSICYDVANLTAPKIITILAGINDFGHDIPLGTLVDNDGYCVAPPETAAECTDFAKGLLYVLSNLKSNYPNAVIIYILPLRNNRLQTNTLGLRLEKYWEYIRIACQAYSVPIINLGTECVLMRGSTYYVDGLHPNVNGQKIMSYFIENYMSLLVPSEF